MNSSFQANELILRAKDIISDFIDSAKYNYLFSELTEAEELLIDIYRYIGLKYNNNIKEVENNEK